MHRLPKLLVFEINIQNIQIRKSLSYQIIIFRENGLYFATSDYNATAHPLSRNSLRSSLRFSRKNSRSKKKIQIRKFPFDDRISASLSNRVKEIRSNITYAKQSITYLYNARPLFIYERWFNNIHVTSASSSRVNIRGRRVDPIQFAT